MAIKISEEITSVKVTIHEIRDTWYRLFREWNDEDFYDDCDEELDSMVDFDDQFDERLREELGGRFDSIDYDDDDFIITLDDGYTLDDVASEIQTVVDMSFGEIAGFGSFVLVLTEDDGEFYQTIHPSCPDFEERFDGINFYSDDKDEDDEDQDDDEVEPELESADNNFIDLAPPSQRTKPAKQKKQPRLTEHRQGAHDALEWLGKKFKVPTKIVYE